MYHRTHEVGYLAFAVAVAVVVGAAALSTLPGVVAGERYADHPTTNIVGYDLRWGYNPAYLRPTTAAAQTAPW